MFSSDTDAERDAAARKRIAQSDDLQAQIQLKRNRMEREAAEDRRHEVREAAEEAAYNPWGRGGAGAPLRDTDGRAIGSLQNILAGGEGGE